MRAHLCLLICGLFLSAGVQAQESAWDPVQALKVGTRLIIEQRAGRTAHGRWESADDARLIVRARGRSLQARSSVLRLGPRSLSWLAIVGVQKSEVNITIAPSFEAQVNSASSE